MHFSIQNEPFSMIACSAHAFLLMKQDPHMANDKSTSPNLDAQFSQSQLDVNTLEERPDNTTMLKLYALYKQASKGANTTPAPGGFDFVGQAKHAAWLALGAMSQDDAKTQYISLVKELLS
jgi:peroxisomal 3,2-trans-enoyl-CoA isomerase